VFREFGLETACAVGFDEALAAARPVPPDVVVCDYDLLATGSLARWERDDFLGRCPVLAVSLTRRPEEQHLLDVNGIAGFLYLPTLTADDVHKLLAYSADVELVLGSRNTRELIWEAANMGWFLRWGNWIVAKLLQVLYDAPSLSDVGCTMRLIHRDALERFRGQLTVGSSHFLPEMVVLARLHNVTMLEIPLNYRSRHGKSKITGNLKGTLVTGFNMVGVILRYRAKRPAALQRSA